MDVRATDSAARPASRAASARSEVSRASAEQASDEVRRMTRQRAKIAADKKKLLARQEAQEAALRADMIAQRADLEAEEEEIAAEVEHAQRMYQLSSGSQALSVCDRVQAWASELHVEEGAEREDDLDEEPTLCEDTVGPKKKVGMEGPSPGVGDSAAGARRANDAPAAAAVVPATAPPATAPNDPRATGTCDFGLPAKAAASRGVVAPTSSARQMAEEAADPAATSDAQTTGVPTMGTDAGATAMMLEVCRSLALFNANAHVKELPRFGGETNEWVAFQAIYKHSTEVGQVSDSLNLLRLQKSLHGRARESVASLLHSPSNVSRIISTLGSLFGDLDEVAYSAVREARSYPKLSEDLSYRELLKYSCKIKNLVATLASLEKADWLLSQDLLAAIVAKLPRTLIAAWVTCPGKPRDKSQLVFFFDSWLEFTLQEFKHSGANPREQMFDVKRGNNAVKGNERFDRRKPVYSAVARGCPLCSGDHLIAQCEAFLAKELDDRWTWSKENNVCYLCLSVGHSRFRCQSKKRFSGRKFHPLLSKERSALGRVPTAGDAAAPGTGAAGRTAFTADRSDGTRPARAVGEPNHSASADNAFGVFATNANQAFLKTVKADLIGPKGRVTVYALLDDGSAISLLEKQVAVKLGLTGPESTLNLHGIGSATISENKSQSISCRIKGANMKRAFSLRAQTVSALNLPPLASVPSDYVQRFPHLNKLSYYQENGAPQLLIGQDNWGLTVSRGIIEKQGCAIALSRTKLGYVPLGMVAESSERECVPSFHVRESSRDEELHESVRRGLVFDGLGADQSSDESMSDEARAAKLLKNTTEVVEGRWSTGLLWRSDDGQLPESESMALSRLRTLERKLDRQTDFAAAYCAKMGEMEKMGYAKLVDRQELVGKSRVWFLPHFAVTNHHKPGKIRIVFDGRAVSRGVSLNHCLLTGPDLYEDLVGILVRFREGRVAFSADIKDMYLRVGMSEEDSYSQLFLWRGMDRESPPKVFRMRTLLFGARSSPASAQYIKNENADRFKQESPKAVKSIKRQFYMDDWLESVDGEEEARELVRETVAICAEGGFQLTRWASNSWAALKDVTTGVQVSASVALKAGEATVNKVLGLLWDPAGDSFRFQLDLLHLEEELLSGRKWPTKREILRLVMSVFDPLGFVGSLLAKAKMLLQSVWQSGAGWDVLIDEHLYQRWRVWLVHLRQIDQVCIPRHYSEGLGKVVSRQLHLFADASAEGMCAAAYIRLVDESGKVAVRLLASRCRVSPLKKLTIPRLELNAALMAARLAKKLQEEQRIEFERRFFWSDSSNVIYWATTGSQHYQVYVANRVVELMQLSTPSEWRWVPGKVNPADEATRSAAAIDLSPDGRWFQGPSFLKLDDAEWPTLADHRADAQSDKLEKKPTFVLAATVENRSIINTDRFSNLNRLLRALALALVFTARCRKRRETGQLTAVDIKTAERVLLLNTQLLRYREEIESLQKIGKVDRSSRLMKLTPVLNEEGLICVGGRIGAVQGVPKEVMFPVILDEKDRVTSLIIDRAHRDLNHAGVEQVLGHTRMRYWIINGRQAVKRQLAQCQYCRNGRVKPQVPRMADLPFERLDHHVRPFTNTALDYFGPYEVTIGRRKELRYGVLFVCLTVRAIHIEVAENLTTDSAIQAIRRFVARRGVPKVMYSDNAATLRGASTELRRAVEGLSDEGLGDAMSARRIQWKHVPPLSPHMAGAWERLVKSVKISLKAVLKERSPRAEVLHTLMAEVEAIVNTRPLVHVSLDSRDAEVLTPQHLLSGYPTEYSAPGEFEAKEVNLRKQWRVTQALSDAFWRTWVTHYLPTLTNRRKWHGEVPNLEVGDLVLVCDGGLARGRWPRAIVVRTFPDRQNRIRVVEIRSGGKYYKRSVARLAKLEVDATKVERPRQVSAVAII